MANSQPKIGIVTVLYNSATVLDGFFESLNAQSYRNFILYAIDNNSPDASLQMTRDLAERSWFKTEVIAEKDNWGVAKGNNIGIERALADNCEYVLLANNDVEFGPDTIANMVRDIEAYNADMEVPKILFYSNRHFWCAGGGYGYKFPTYHRGRPQADRGQYDKAEFVEYSPTCFMLIKADVFSKTGLMDERYFAYFDDTDFVWRAVKIHGLKLLYTPSATVLHKVGVSSKGLKKFAFYLSTRNSAYFMTKYFPWYRRWPVYTYQTLHYFLCTLKHPSYPSILTYLSHYREGWKMAEEWLAENSKNNTIPKKDL